MRIDFNHWLTNKPIAHRGLWGNGVVENSIAAYELAAKHSMPIEIDVYLTKDGRLVCFHDKSLKRMTGADGFIYDKTLLELQSLSLFNTDQKIPTLEQVLDVAREKSPLLIEIKDQPNKKVVDALVKALKNYDGEFAVQSFNPFYLLRLKKLAPNFIRGVLGTEYRVKTENALTRFVIRRMPLNFMIKPHFISYSYTGLPLKKSKVKDKVVLAWTITDTDTAKKIKKWCDNYIFENFIPE